MTAIPADFPWRAGMRILPNADGGFRYARILIMDDGVPVCTAVEQRVGLSRHVGPWIEAWNEHAPNDKDVPDLTDPATVGALAEAVREAFNRPDLETYRGGGGYFIADFAPENEPEPDEDWPTLRTDATFGVNNKAEVSGVTRGEAWLAAWNARPKASA